MSLDRGRGLYHCFGCGEGGDVFAFVQETQGLGFGDALELLARRAGITLTEDPASARKRGQRGAAVEAIRRASDFYHDRLKKAADAGPARAYLRSRGYGVEVIDEWRVGFSGTTWDSMSKELRAAGMADKVLIDAGLSRRGRQGLYDVFRGRLMFPINDLRGDPIGFGARKVDGVGPESTNNPDAKYVNSAESMVYRKARVLFGLDRARRHISDDSPAVVVEGYTDVIAMHEAGIRTAVATCGTALGDSHFDLLRRFGEKVVLAFDSDEAGSKAALAWRRAGIALPARSRFESRRDAPGAGPRRPGPGRKGIGVGVGCEPGTTPSWSIGSNMRWDGMISQAPKGGHGHSTPPWHICAASTTQLPARNTPGLYPGKWGLIWKTWIRLSPAKALKGEVRHRRKTGRSTDWSQSC